MELPGVQDEPFTPCFSVFVRIGCYVNKQKRTKHSAQRRRKEEARERSTGSLETRWKKEREQRLNFHSRRRDEDNSEVENFTRPEQAAKHLLRLLTRFSDICICFGFELPLLALPTELPVLKDENGESISVIVLETRKRRWAKIKKRMKRTRQRVGGDRQRTANCENRALTRVHVPPRFLLAIFLPTFPSFRHTHPAARSVYFARSSLPPTSLPFEKIESSFTFRELFY